MNLSNYYIDIGSHFFGRTIIIQAHSAKQAYKQAMKEVNEKKMEQIIQIRDERNCINYSIWNQHRLTLTFKENK